jgi:hypothetical protein
MIDPAVERQYSDTRELLALWNTFHQFFTIGVKSEGITPEKENQFLELKSRIAMLHDSFMEALTHNQNVGQEVLSIITRAITLKHLGRLSTADVKKMEIEWHEAYLLLNDTIAALEQRRRELADINESQYRAKQAAGMARQKAGKFFGSFYFKLLAIIAAVLFATIGIQVLGIYDYDELGKISALRTPYNWGKALVRATYDEDSPWPSIESVGRKAYGGWPEGIKAPQVDTSAEKDRNALQLAQRARQLGIGPQLAAGLQKAVEYRLETAEKQGEQNMEIHTFRFNNATEAKAVEKLWEDAESRYSSANERPTVLSQLDFVRNVNVVTVIFASKEETLRRFAYEVYGKQA